MKEKSTEQNHGEKRTGGLEILPETVVLVRGIDSVGPEDGTQGDESSGQAGFRRSTETE